MLVVVLLMSLATWTLLTGLLMTSFLQYRLALAADRSAVAHAAARSTVAALAAEATASRSLTGTWPAVDDPVSIGACELELVAIEAAAAWWRATVRGRFEGVVAIEEATVRAP